MEEKNEQVQLTIIERLAGAAPAERLTAIAELEQAQAVSPETLSRLENLAAADKSKPVREAATRALDFAPVRRARMTRAGTLGITNRQVIAREIDQWQQQGLLGPELASLLKSRYIIPYGPPTGQKPAADPNAPKPTLAQTLLSETSIRTFLYLGAFFVVSASLILAALVELLRLPILVVLILLFGGAALFIKKRLPQPSSVLFIVASALLPITAGVIADTVKLEAPWLHIFWMVVYGLMALFWVFATWFYDSRLFSLATYAALLLAAKSLADALAQPFDLMLLILAITNLASLAWVYALRRWKKEDAFSRPLFITTQLGQIMVLGASFFAVWVYYFDFGEDARSVAWWIAAAMTWIVGALFYFGSHWLNHRKGLFPSLAVLALIPVGWLVSLAFESSLTIQAIVWLAWGLAYAIKSEILPRIKVIPLPSMEKSMLFSSFGLLATSTVFASIAEDVDNRSGLVFITCLTISLTYAGLHIISARRFVWGAALTTGLLAYFAFLNLEIMQNINIDLVWVVLIPTVLLLLPDAIFNHSFPKEKEWRIPVQIFGGLLTFWLIGTLLLTSDSHVPKIAGGLIATLVALFYAWRKHAWLGYVALLLLAITLLNGMEMLNLTAYSFGLVVLALLYYLGGFVLRIIRPEHPWSKVFLFSGLGLGSFVSFLAISENETGVMAFLPAAVTALLWTAEAFKRRNILLGFPSNGFYLLAYIIILARMDVNQAQFYSVGAAAFGFLQHYLLVRSGKEQALAFLTGLVSQLALLGTTYIQMVVNVELAYFAALFFQSLVVMIYGLVIRSRSLFMVPIGFVVLGVFTVVLTLLEGLATFILIGCTGIFMILIGIVAVLLRERIAKMGERLGDWNA